MQYATSYYIGIEAKLEFEAFLSYWLLKLAITCILNESLKINTGFVPKLIVLDSSGHLLMRLITWLNSSGPKLIILDSCGYKLIIYIFNLRS